MESAWHSFPGPERADQYGRGVADSLADEVEAPVNAVGAVHVRVARRPEHRRVALRSAAVSVRRRVLVVVRLDLDDHAADAVAEELDADQVWRHVVHGAREELSVDHDDLR
jgi:hypothetical protein